MLRTIKNNNFTNKLIKWAVVGGDFLLLWLLLHFAVGTIPHSDEWSDDKMRLFWLVNTVALMVSEGCFSTVIHQRMVGAGDIMRRCTLLSMTQVLLSYLMLRVLHFMARLGWQLFFFGVVFQAALVLLRLVERRLLKSLRRRGYNTRNATLIGSNPELQRLRHKLVSNATYGYRIRNVYENPHNALADEHLGDEVYLCVPCRERELIEQTAKLCDRQMAKFYYVPPAEEKLNLQPLLMDDMEVMTTYTSPLEEPLNRAVKRVTDVVLSVLVLLPSALLLPFIVIAIKRQSPGPVFFRQRRTGIDGREFWCLKFRSMHVNSDADRVQATRDDPRKFPFGNFMRKTNIDELPQFWNVLRGDMSIVGPRPHMLAHTEQYRELIGRYMVRHFVKPGVTGWAQVTGFRGETRELWQMEGRVERDIWYIQHWSLWLDLRIIWMTVKTIFKRDEKAY